MVLRGFARIDLGCEPAPDEATILRMRYLLEEHGPSRQHPDMENLKLAICGVRITTGIFVDAAEFKL